MAEHTLRRTGKPPLVFDGELLTEVDGERQGGRDQNRWHELALYRLATGGYVLRIAYHTRWQGELDHDRAYVVNSPIQEQNVIAIEGRLSSHLADIDAGQIVRGYPPGSAYTDRQAALMADVKARYLDQVSDLLDSPEFAQRPEQRHECAGHEAVFTPSSEGGFTVHVPDLPGCVSEGETLEEARANIIEAITLYQEKP